MLTVRAGDVRQFTLKGRELTIAEGAALSIIPSGGANEFKTAGNGTMYGTGKRVMGQIKGIDISIDNSEGDLEYIASIRDDGEPVPVTLTLWDYSVYSGSLGIEGDLEYKTDTGVASFEMRGPKLEQI
jgi:hypothetical protein